MNVRVTVITSARARWYAWEGIEERLYPDVLASTKQDWIIASRCPVRGVEVCPTYLSHQTCEVVMHFAISQFSKHTPPHRPSIICLNLVLSCLHSQSTCSKKISRLCSQTCWEGKRMVGYSISHLLTVKVTMLFLVYILFLSNQLCNPCKHVLGCLFVEWSFTFECSSSGASAHILDWKIARVVRTTIAFASSISSSSS